MRSPAPTAQASALGFWPDRKDTWGLVVNEAMARRAAPVIVSNGLRAARLDLINPPAETRLGCLKSSRSRQLTAPCTATRSPQPPLNGPSDVWLRATGALGGVQPGFLLNGGLEQAVVSGLLSQVFRAGLLSGAGACPAI